VEVIILTTIKRGRKNMGNYTANASMDGQGTGGHLHRVKTLAKEKYAGKYLQLRKIWLTGFRARPARKGFPEKRAGGAKVLKKQAKGEMRQRARCEKELWGKAAKRTS
jgi:hypothetical protein